MDLKDLCSCRKLEGFFGKNRESRSCSTEGFLRRACLLLFLCFLFLPGCGYRVRGGEPNLPPEIRSVAIPIFGNRTIETGIESLVTEALVEKFVSARRLSVGTRSSADALLTGTVKAFATVPVAVTSSTQVSTENRATLTIDFTFQDQRSGKVLLRQAMSDWRNYPVVSDLNATEQFKREAIRQISVLLAQRMYELILWGF
jgi:hypothetical protein